MDLNLVCLSGELAAEPEFRTFESGARLARYLVSVRTSQPRTRLDVVPVTVWEPDDEAVSDPPGRGRRVWITAQVQRRFWTAPDGRNSRLELVASHVGLTAPAPVEMEWPPAD